MRSALMPCGTWTTVLRSFWLWPSIIASSEPIGTRDMLSTPPPTAQSWKPLTTPMAAKFTACRPEPQKRLSVTPVTVVGPAGGEDRVARDARALLLAPG